jgi:hypothetical protein
MLHSTHFLDWNRFRCREISLSRKWGPSILCSSGLYVEYHLYLLQNEGSGLVVAQYDFVDIPCGGPLPNMFKKPRTNPERHPTTVPPSTTLDPSLQRYPLLEHTSPCRRTLEGFSQQDLGILIAKLEVEDSAIPREDGAGTAEERHQELEQ